ncbi:MFS transporter [Amycolatopsis sp. NBRC 101858]|uniref:MFS transporter n=1 Tax=Amycolatopsis sp. NBRC 101858 TaxID=3032200 RepID=UPI0024A4CEBB|nr:MFS transporter [Amycolatopsis sp. NBRC 101858]GLY39814.1 MFS transporter [Amycolatopsis sp. NBRC 101858]
MSTRELGGTAAATVRLSIRVTALCWVLVLLDGLDLFVYGATLPGVLADKSFGLTPVTGGTIGSLTTFGMMLGALGAGILTDRTGRRKIIITGVTVFSLAAAACAAAPTVEFFGAARFVAGIGLGGLLPSAIAMVMEYAPAWRKNLAVTTVMTAHQAGGALAGALGMTLVQSLGWRSVYWIGALLLVVVLPAVVLLLPESLTFFLAKGKTDRARAIAGKFAVSLDTFAPEPADDRRGGLRGLFTPSVRMTTLLFWIASFAGLLLVYGVNTWLPTMMRGSGYNLGSAISFLLVINLGGIAGMLVAGRLADRFGARPVAIIWFALTACGVGLLAVHMPLVVTYVVVFLTGAWLFSAQTLIYAAVGAYYPADSRATALGWVSGVGRTGAVFGPWLGGILVAGGLSSLGFVVFAIAGVLGAVMVFLVRQKTNSAMASADRTPVPGPQNA